MKTILNPRRNQRGSVLVVGLIITFILGVTLASYLLMTRGHNLSVVRSQTWNSSFAITEAGVEDALAMLNKNEGNFEMLRTWTNAASLTADNWSSISANVYHTRRYIGDNYYDAYITNFNSGASVRAIGTIAWNYSYASAPQGLLATVGVKPSTSASLSRRVDVQTRLDALFNFALAAVNAIELNGNNVESDSFDSLIPDYNTGGMYDPNKNKAGGDIVSNDTIQNALNVGNAQIKGLVKTGPNGTVTLGPDGSVGDEAWVDGGNTGIQDGHYTDDMNFVWEKVVLPPPNPVWRSVSSGLGVVAGYRTNGITYDYYFTQGGDFQVYGGNLTRGVLIAPNVQVRLNVYAGDVKIPGTGEIRIPANAGLKVYMAGALFSIGGSGVVNEGGYAVNFQYYGLPTNTQIDFQGNGDFTGCIYAPNANFYLGGGGSGTVDFIGSSITKTVTLKGHYHFHYDEALRNVSPSRGYIPTNWKEI